MQCSAGRSSISLLLAVGITRYRIHQQSQLRRLEAKVWVRNSWNDGRDHTGKLKFFAVGFAPHHIRLGVHMSGASPALMASLAIPATMTAGRPQSATAVPIFERLKILINGVNLDLSVMHTLPAQRTNIAPLLFLHGFGSTKEDYADAIRHRHLQHHPIIAYDAPGTGETSCSDLSAISIPFLVKTAIAVLEAYRVNNFHVVGHSMGGLTALLLCNQLNPRALSFTNIEGNISPEDCFLSRQVILHADPDPNSFFEEFIERARRSTQRSSALYAASLQFKVRAEAVKAIFSSMVDLSDNEDLMSMFIGLSCPKMFMYGEENRHLSYLKSLPSRRVKVVEIEDSGHWPMYSNPVRMWDELAAFLSR